MQISTRGRYGLRAMLELARGFGQPPLLMGTVAERQGLSRKYLHALLSALKSAGLVRSVRGTHGGFVLARPPAEIKLSEVLLALEGPLSLVDCVADGRACDRARGCPTRRVWQQLAEALENVLENVTLADLATPEVQKRSRRADNRNGSAMPRRALKTRATGAVCRPHRQSAG